MLLELVVSIAVATILVASGSALMIYMFKKQSQQFKVAGMYSDLHPAFEMVSRRIALAGTWANAQDGKPYYYTGGGSPTPDGGTPTGPEENPFQRTGWDLQVLPGYQCILFSYDRNRDGVASFDERTGYRLNEGALEEGNNVTSCAAGDWAKLTDSRAANILSLEFIITSVAVDSTFIKRSVHMELRAKPSTVSGTPILLKRIIRVRNDKAI